MAESTPQGDTAASTEEAQENQDTTAPPEIDWKSESRKWESRAKENLAAARANEDAAKRLAEIEESQKTEAQKQADALAEAQAQIAELAIAKVRAEVAAAKGVPAELLTGSTQEELEGSADALIAFRGERPKGPIIPSQGATPTAPTGTTADVFAAWSEENFQNL